MIQINVARLRNLKGIITTIRIVLAFFDLILSCVLFPFFLFVCFLIGFQKKGDSKFTGNNVMLQVISSHPDEIYRKYGNLDKYLEFNPNRYFSHVYVICFMAPYELQLNLRDDVTIITTKVPFHFFYLSYYILLTIRLIFFILNRNVTIVQAKQPYIDGLLGLIASKVTKTPFCISIHADYDLGFKLGGGTLRILGSRKLAKRLEKIVFSRAKFIMPIRRALIQYVLRSGAPKKYIHVIPHGIDFKKFDGVPQGDIINEYGLNGKKVVSFVGRLSKENYVYDSIKMIAQVLGRQNNTVLLILGDGNERHRLEELSRDLGISDRIRFLGFQPFHKVVQVRRGSDANLCLMGGFSLIEAAASGRPVISYDVDWHSELIIDGETGFILPEGDICGAADAILRVFRDKELAVRIGRNARKIALERHSIETTNLIKIRCYEELLQTKKS